MCSATELSKIRAGLKAERNPSRLQALFYSKAAALHRMMQRDFTMLRKTGARVLVKKAP